MTEMYTSTKKNDWLKYLKVYHSLYKTQSKEPYPIKRLSSDYRSELQSYIADDQIQKEEISFGPSALYFQE